MRVRRELAAMLSVFSQDLSAHVARLVLAFYIVTCSLGGKNHNCSSIQKVTKFFLFFPFCGLDEVQATFYTDMLEVKSCSSLNFGLFLLVAHG